MIDQALIFIPFVISGVKTGASLSHSLKLAASSLIRNSESRERRRREENHVELLREKALLVSLSLSVSSTQTLPTQFISPPSTQVQDYCLLVPKGTF